MSTYVPLEGFGGNGSANLNFKVIGNPRPEKPSKNTLWVDTDNISCWSIGAMPDQIDGALWIPTDPTSHVSFNALKKNCIMVHPSMALAYTTSKGYAARPVQLYDGTSWVDIWDGYLYNRGDEYIDRTGGWIEHYNGVSAKGSVTKQSGGIRLYGASGKASIVKPGTPIDLTNIGTLTAVFSTVNNSTMCGVCVVNVGKPMLQDNYVASEIKTIYGASGDTFISVDVSGLSGNFDVGVAATIPTSGSYLAALAEFRMF